MKKAPAFIPVHHLGSEMKGFKFEGLRAHRPSDDVDDRQFVIEWWCPVCSRNGSATFWFKGISDDGIYECIDRSHRDVTSGLCINKRRHIKPARETGLWKDATGKERRDHG